MCIRLKTCCGCNDLEKGCRIIALIGIVSGAFAIVKAAIAMDFASIIGDLIGIGIR